MLSASAGLVVSGEKNQMQEREGHGQSLKGLYSGLFCGQCGAVSQRVSSSETRIGFKVIVEQKVLLP